MWIITRSCKLSSSHKLASGELWIARLHFEMALLISLFLHYFSNNFLLHVDKLIMWFLGEWFTAHFLFSNTKHWISSHKLQNSSNIGGWGGTSFNKKKLLPMSIPKSMYQTTTPSPPPPPSVIQSDTYKILLYIIYVYIHDINFLVI